MGVTQLALWGDTSYSSTHISITSISRKWEELNVWTGQEEVFKFALYSLRDLFPHVKSNESHCGIHSASTLG